MRKGKIAAIAASFVMLASGSAVAQSVMVGPNGEVRIDSGADGLVNVGQDGSVRIVMPSSSVEVGRNMAVSTSDGGISAIAVGQDAQTSNCVGVIAGNAQISGDVTIDVTADGQTVAQPCETLE